MSSISQVEKRKLLANGLGHAPGMASLATKVLIVVREKGVQDACSEAVAALGAEYAIVRDQASAHELLRNGAFGIVVLYLKLPGDQGLDLLRNIKRRFPLVKVIVLAAYGTIQSAVQVMRSGAEDYLITPLSSEEVMVAIVRAGNSSGEFTVNDSGGELGLKGSIEHAERRAILDALAQTRGNKNLAARLLGIGRTTLYQKLKRIYGQRPAEMSAAVLRAKSS